MQRVALGNSELKVSSICLGTWQFNDSGKDPSGTWDSQPFEVSRDITLAALSNGINFIDTAQGYRNSEDVLGRILAGRRQEVVLASKFTNAIVKGGGVCQASDVEASLLGSLQKLQTDYLDLYQIHWPDAIGDNHKEVVQELERQKSLGRIKEYGVSNFGVQNMTDFLAAGGKPVSNQLCYNLLARGIEYEILPMCVEKGISVLSYSPLQQGLLSGKYLSPEDVPEGRRRTIHFDKSSTPLSRHGQDGYEEDLFAAIRGVKDACEQSNVPMAGASLAWALGQPGVVSTIVGARTPEQVAENVRASEIAAKPLMETLSSCTEKLKVAMGPGSCDLWGQTSRIK